VRLKRTGKYESKRRKKGKKFGARGTGTFMHLDGQPGQRNIVWPGRGWKAVESGRQIQRDPCRETPAVKGVGFSDKADGKAADWVRLGLATLLGSWVMAVPSNLTK
jgi:hypothetical protein